MSIYRKMIIRIATAVVASTMAMQANAAVISVVGPDSVNVGETFNIDLVVSGFESIDLGAFDLDLSYDDSLVEFSSYSLGSALTDSFFGQQDWSMGETMPGTINLSELSFLVDFSLQPDTFTLASLTFDAMNIGAATYGFTYLDFTDGLGNTIILDTTEGNVLVKAVPAPGTLLLFAFALLGALLPKFNFVPFAWFRPRNRLLA